MKSYDIHHTPYSIYHTPYTIHHTLYTIHHTPYTMHHKDAFMKVSFGGGKSLKTKVVTVNGESRNLMNPYFNAELWYPISVPTMTQVLRMSMWDKNDVGKYMHYTTYTKCMFKNHTYTIHIPCTYHTHNQYILTQFKHMCTNLSYTQSIPIQYKPYQVPRS
ncbi:hypothetical protein EON63_13270 [archaeon]|nr:MAG: hypothetical protein EON63_13270 [archaeon]